MSNLKLYISAQTAFSYYVYQNDNLITHGQYNNQNVIDVDFIPCAVNKIRFYVHGATQLIAITDIEVDGFKPLHACLSGKVYPVPNEVEATNICFPGSHLSRDGFVEFCFTWPFDIWYFDWMKDTWNTNFLNN